MNSQLETPIVFDDYGISEKPSFDKEFTKRSRKTSVLYGPIRYKENMLSANAFKYVKKNKHKLLVAERDVGVITLKNKHFVTKFNEDLELVKRKEKKRVPKMQKSILIPSKHFRMTSCPIECCSAIIDMRALFSHYMEKHHHLEVPFIDIDSKKKKSINLVVNILNMKQDRNTLIGVFAYERKNLNPLECARNSFLPKSLQKYSKHTIIMFFACRTYRYFIAKCKTTPIGIKKELKEILIIWAVSPTPDIPLAIRGTIRDPENKRYYRKYLTFRSLQDNQHANEFIDNDTNCIVCSIDELLPLTDDQEKTLKIDMRIKEGNLNKMKILAQKIKVE